MFPFGAHPLGSTLMLVPNHSCLSAACFGVYHIVNEAPEKLGAESDVTAIWKSFRGW